MNNEIFARIVSKHDSVSNWNINKNFILLEGEIAFEFDADKKPRFKVGDGVTPWKDLEYFTSSIDETSIDTKIALAIAEANHLSYKIVSSIDKIDLSDSASNNIIYLIPRSPTSDNSYDEYMIIEGELERVGSTDIDLSDYAKTQYVNDALADKISKQEGKGLSANDFTDQLLAKLNGISDKAQENVIESLYVGGIKSIPQGKAVNVPVSTQQSFGVVKGSMLDNKISVAADGTMIVNSVDVNRLVNNENTCLIMDSGDSTNKYT